MPHCLLFSRALQKVELLIIGNIELMMTDLQFFAFISFILKIVIVFALFQDVLTIFHKEKIVSNTFKNGNNQA